MIHNSVMAPREAYGTVLLLHFLRGDEAQFNACSVERTHFTFPCVEFVDRPSTQSRRRRCRVGAQRTEKMNMCLSVGHEVNISKSAGKSNFETGICNRNSR